MTHTRLRPLTMCLVMGLAGIYQASAQQSDDYNLSEGVPVTPAAKKVTLPLYIFGDPEGRPSLFAPSGYMGDTNALSSLTSAYDVNSPAPVGSASHASLRVRYKSQGKQGWSGLYYQSPANNWGRLKGGGVDLSKANKLTFWARGENGGERISQIKMGGINGPYPDSDSASMGPIVLTKDWKQYTLDLNNKDLRHIVGGFMFLVRRADNPRGATFYFDEIVYREASQDEASLPAKKSDENKAVNAVNAPRPEAEPEPAAKAQSTAVISPTSDVSGPSGTGLAAQARVAVDDPVPVLYSIGGGRVRPVVKVESGEPVAEAKSTPKQTPVASPKESKAPEADSKSKTKHVEISINETAESQAVPLVKPPPQPARYLRYIKSSVR